MGKYKRKPGSRRCRDYDENTLCTALQYMKWGMNSRRAQEIFKISIVVSNNVGTLLEYIV